AKSAARLSHPNAVTVFDWGADAGTFYIVMESIPTTDLRDLLVANGALAPAQAAVLIAQVCDALAAAHKIGLVHRSLRPENILISKDGNAKVADFGIGAGVPREDPSSSGMTTAVRYIAPEQALGFEASVTSDIWTAGAILSEMLTGRPPLQGAGPDLLDLRAHEEPVPPSRFDHSIPVDLDDVVLKACALDPAERFYDASDMAHALRRAGARSLPEAPPVESLVEDISTEFEVVPGPGTFVKEQPSGRHSKPRLRLRLGRIFVTLLVLTGLVLGGVAGANFLLAPVMVEVPKTVGMELPEARAEVRGDGLGLEVERVLDIEEPKGVVLKQTPATGELEEGDALEVLVSAGPPKLRIPTVEGESATLARARIRASKFEVGRVLRRYSSIVDRGDILKQLPDKGKHEWGSKVHLVISKGPPPVELPKVEGTPVGSAMKRLRRAGLRPHRVDVYSDTLDAGLVISTRPRAGRTVKKGSSVEVVASIGPEFEEVTVPDVRNQRVDDAVAELAALGLQSQAVGSCKRSKRVVDTDPAAGAVLRENETVTLLVC
ncbi:MAG: PASTA domain-containing protein, partial [Actinomycetota bacterium]|nr:PASTA domain-containing protein [Actinomycetota bacterium]